MRPIRLELTGLNSYIDKQVIDFEKLIEEVCLGYLELLEVENLQS